MTISIQDRLKEYSSEAMLALNSVNGDSLKTAYNRLHEALSFKSNIFVCGNGGSAAISDHFMCDHSKGVCSDTMFTPRVFSLASNMSLVTAIANDYSYKEVYSTQLDMFGKPGDVLVAISSSGQSPNIVSAITTAKNVGMTSIALVGFDGGEAARRADIVLHIKSNNYGVIEDCHQSLMHILAQHLRVNNARQDASLKL